MTLYSREEVEEILIFARDVFNSFANAENQVIPDDKIFVESRGVKIDVYLEDRHYSEIMHSEPGVSLAENIISVMEKIYGKIKDVGLDLDDLELKIAIFSNLVEIENIHDFELGKNGLMCDYVGYKGILFPNEIYNDKVRFLEALCKEANLNRDAWQNPNMKLYSFTSQEIGRVI
jgi:hypothetical protein